MTDGNGVLTSPTLLQHLDDPAHREVAWRVFLNRYQPLIYGWSRRMGLDHNDAEDISADVLSKLLTALRGFVYDPAHSFRGWLRTLVENKVLTLYRQRARRQGDQASGHPLAHQVLAEHPTPDPVGEMLEQLDDSVTRDLRDAEEVIRRVRARVQASTWEAFWLTAIGEQSGRDVAARLGLSVGAVYVAKRRVAQMLRAEAERLRGAPREGGES
jgi:RNA polymerase sigma-70 factor (ECF subfamily)